MKKTMLRTRIIATALAVIMILSVVAASGVSASAEKVKSVPGEMAYQAGLGLIRAYLPGGPVIVGPLDTLISSFSDKGPSLSDISDEISALRDEINEQFSDIKKQMQNYTEQIENKIVDQTVIAGKGTGFDKLMTGLEETDRQINAINGDTTLNDKEKAVEIASLIGKNTEWIKNNNLLFGYQDFMNTLGSSSFADQKDRDLYQVVYNDFTSKVMFSGEALDMANPYISRVLLLGLYAYSINSQCLKAAKTVSEFTAADEGELNKDELINYHAVKSLTSIVNAKINDMNDRMFDMERSDSVVTHFGNYAVNSSRTVFLNNGTTNKPFGKTIKSADMTKLGNDFDGFLDLMDNGGLSHEEINALIAYVKSAYPKNTLREYLTYVGFDMDSVPKDARFVVGNEEVYGHSGKGDWDGHQFILKIPFERPMVSIDDADISCSYRLAYYRIVNYYGAESLSSDCIINFNAA